ncbi:MAG: hypothetical protein M5U32_19080 [Myxococcota bacterium]|nr:hypothetical protein [Myxococcota bacterium]
MTDPLRALAVNAAGSGRFFVGKDKVRARELDYGFVAFQVSDDCS